MVYSGYRFVQAAAEAGKPLAAVNLGLTRADELLTLKVTQDCSEALAFLLEPAPPSLNVVENRRSVGVSEAGSRGGG